MEPPCSSFHPENRLKVGLPLIHPEFCNWLSRKDLLEVSSIQGVSCVILTGGESKRMGADKAHVQLAGRTLIERVLATVMPLFDDVMISGRDNTVEIDGTRFVKDRHAGRGPVIGICASMQEARHPYLFAIACDMPFVTSGLIEALVSSPDGYDVVVPMCGGRPEPLCALYSKACLKALAERVENGERGLVSFIENTPELKVRRISEQELRKIDPALRSFMDIDSSDALAEAERIMV